MPNRYVIRTPTEAQQANSWSPPRGVLGELVTRAQERAGELQGRRPDLERRAAAAPRPPSFIGALAGEDVAVIAEVKRASPSRGLMSPTMDAPARAVAYARGGAAAISVVTEPTRFGGSLSDLEAISAAVSIPVLRKDFIVAEGQVLEARGAGASAILIIVRALPPERLRRLAAFAGEVGLDVLFEVRTAPELELAVDAGAHAIGVNARDLETLEVDVDRFGQIAPLIPLGCICVAESGLATAADVARAAEAGADAVLVGSALTVATDPVSAVRSLTKVARRSLAARH